jgi:hypothetical protein
MRQHISALVCREAKPCGLPALVVIEQVTQTAPLRLTQRVGPGTPETDSIIFFHRSTELHAMTTSKLY